MNWIKTTLSKIIETSKSPKKQKEFGYLSAFVIFIILGISIYKNGLVLNQSQIFIGSSLLLILLITFTLKRIFLPFLTLWLLVGELLGFVTSYFIMGIVYFTLFSPISLLLRLFKKEKTYKAAWVLVDRKIDYKKLS
ncbi:SxtJ family membrane protein [Oceanihabitans sp. 2_MG-2023]|uniref:SxtJ family membrane protein n=1 Tax=Oceanihabitans sp. 2_MG-2023 TaxID=3062661 RepID=UPI0026E31DCB|nr:SxtJ family membrane protein [Oceanihabitans sp. 2_MG-2023]MDO6596432.1 SxtJ family membrane protein [Oceanihabitans sp. 2_MG-2023]